MVKKKRTQVSSRVLFQTADMQLYHTKFGDQYRTQMMRFALKTHCIQHMWTEREYV